MIIDRTQFRASTPVDYRGITQVHRRAFGRAVEAELAITLLDSGTQTFDLVAVLDEMIVGHVIASKVEGPQKAVALGPLAVDPDWRDFQIGTELTSRLLSQLRIADWNAAFVLGDPVYYGRFGFTSTLADQVRCAYQCQSFQALELKPDGLAGYCGEVRYPEPFHGVD